MLDFTFQQKMELDPNKEMNVMLKPAIQNHVVIYKLGFLFWLTYYVQERKIIVI